MRVVTDRTEITFAVERCRSEARRAFGDDEIYVEQLLPHARHIEVQVIGDGTGAVSHLWDRECSVQRRHQKLIEIAPCPTLEIGHRQPILDAACTMAAAVVYLGLGTFEFLVDADDPAASSSSKPILVSKSNTPSPRRSPASISSPPNCR
jgi:acetyl/propionyl-CoA carboxylase alpha subunit